MFLNPIILREYDIRGIVDVQLSVQDAYLIGKGYGTLVRRAEGKTIVVGYDGRLTSKDLEKSLIEGLKSTGLKIICIGLGPSPFTYFATHYLSTDASIMVTGSHNPPNYNGFKMTLFRKPFYGADIQTLGQLIEQQDFIKASEEYVELCDLEEAYLQYLIQDFKLNYPASRPLKVVWDAGNGAVGNILQKLVHYLPGTHFLLNERIDGTFPAHHPDPLIAKNLKQLIETIKKEKADLGFAFDGDGDRIGIVDSQGHIIVADQLLMLLSAEVLKTHPGSYIIADVKSSQKLFEEIRVLGGIPIMGCTGHSLIRAKMLAFNAPLGGEMSGHIFFADRHFGSDDAIYVALRTLGLISTQIQDLSIWYKNLPKLISTPEIRLPCNNKFFVIEKIKQVLETAKIPFNNIDGIRVTKQEGWWLLRSSNTEEDLVARIEAKTQEDLDFLRIEVNSYLKDFNLCLPQQEFTEK